MTRETELALSLAFTATPGALNVADLLTEPLVGAAFRLMRAVALGLGVLDLEAPIPADLSPRGGAWGSGPALSRAINSIVSALQPGLKLVV